MGKINYNERMMLGHRDISWKIGVYFGQGLVPYAYGNLYQPIGKREFNSMQRERLILSCMLARNVTYQGVATLLVYKSGVKADKAPLAVIEELAVIRDRSARKTRAKKLFDDTDLNLTGVSSLLLGKPGVAGTVADVKNVLKFHLIWTSIGLLGNTIDLAPYVAHFKGSGAIPMSFDAHLYDTLGQSRFEKHVKGPVFSDTMWWACAGISHVHSELYQFGNENHGVTDSYQQQIGEDVIHINGATLNKSGGYYLMNTAWTIIHEYSHLVSGTSDAVESTPAITDIYFSMADRTGKSQNYDKKTGTVVDKQKAGAKYMSLGEQGKPEGTARIYPTTATRKYNMFTSKAHLEHLPADILTAIMFRKSRYYLGMVG